MQTDNRTKNIGPLFLWNDNNNNDKRSIEKNKQIAFNEKSEIALKQFDQEK